MEDIARAAGVTKGTPYLYFQNKEDIFKAMVLHHLSSRLGAFVELEQQHQGPVGELLQILLLKWWDEVGATPAAGLCKLAIAEATNFPELAQFYTNEVISPCLSMVEHILRRGMDSGEFRPAHRQQLRRPAGAAGDGDDLGAFLRQGGARNLRLFASPFPRTPERSLAAGAARPENPCYEN